MRIIIIVLFIWIQMLVPDCNKIKNSESMNGGNEKMVSLDYLALGDSYTIGESVAKNERWPVQLVSSLEKEQFLFDSLTIIAKTGWTTDELMQGIKEAKLTGPFDLVSLLIGVNNQYRGRSSEEFRIQFKTLLDTAITYAGGNKDRVFVVSIPDWGVTPFAAGRDRERISQEIDEFNLIKEEVCSEEGILFIWITGISREVSMDADLLAADGLHPSGKMYGRWVDELIKEAIKNKLN